MLRPVFVCPDPIRGGRQRPGHVRGAAHRHDPAPDQHPRRAAPRSPRSTPTRSRCSASSRSTRSSRTAARSAGPRAATPARRARTTAASAPTRSAAVTSSRPTPRPASTPASHISGTNAEVMIGQWEFQIGPIGPPLEVGDQLWHRPLAALPHRRGLRRRGHHRPEADAGRLERRRRPHQLLDQGHARELRRRSSRRARRSARTPRSTSSTTAPASSIASPACTRPPRGPSSATACPNRGASVRIPWQVEVGQEGLHRGSSAERQLDPYVVTRLIVETCCGASPSRV